MKFLITCVIIGLCHTAHAQAWSIGQAKVDITGPATGVGMMGYGQLQQTTAGIHTRLWSRAFVIENPNLDDANHQQIVAIATVDLCFVTHAVKAAVIQSLQTKLAKTFDYNNVLIQASHTHSGPGGYAHHHFFNITTLGFVKENFNFIVTGITNSIVEAYERRTSAKAFLASDDLNGTQLNRSPAAWKLNPEAQNGEVKETNTKMSQLSFESADGAAIGLINWFALHNTSISNAARWISSDNKGLAAFKFETHMKSSQGTNNFVAAFGNSNEGDASPLIDGFDRKNDKYGFVNNELQGHTQFIKAKELFESSERIDLDGDISFSHIFIDFSKEWVESKWSGLDKDTNTCASAMGVSFAAGAEDGPGGVGIPEGVTVHNTFSTGSLLRAVDLILGPFSMASFFVDDPCQYPKKILLQTGLFRPTPWSPKILPLQLIRLGSVWIAAVPFEMTTVAGHRLEKSLRQIIHETHPNDSIIISGLANEYADYVTTPEEYSLQHYEGASTLYGPATLGAVVKNLSLLAESLSRGDEIFAGKQPPDLSDEQFSLRAPNAKDSRPRKQNFGHVLVQPKSTYLVNEKVVVEFRGANLSNNFEKIRSFLEVQHYDPASQNWLVVANDDDPTTLISWNKKTEWNCLVNCSRTNIEWLIPKNTISGTYRILYRGYAHEAFQKKPKYFEGISSEFEVIY